MMGVVDKGRLYWGTRKPCIHVLWHIRNCVLFDGCFLAPYSVMAFQNIPGNDGWGGWLHGWLRLWLGDRKLGGRGCKGGMQMDPQKNVRKIEGKMHVHPPPHGWMGG